MRLELHIFCLRPPRPPARLGHASAGSTCRAGLQGDRGRRREKSSIHWFTPQMTAMAGAEPIPSQETRASSRSPAQNERDLPSIGSLLKCYNSWSWAILKPGARNFICVSHVGGRYPSIWTIFYCLPSFRSRDGSTDEKMQEEFGAGWLQETQTAINCPLLQITLPFIYFFQETEYKAISLRVLGWLMVVSSAHLLLLFCWDQVSNSCPCIRG
ncbi:uncharacterized protein LOC133757676 [Lepus europaeus]|uniref:uncharacterized protein LOC133757676 n=1 Tax=Lepus europaeus TaxID=9983 RepID=UPI002B46F237|nr:uncharacterized protein LOC133757676 [Lepus europaeus]XP_062044321.1 uncharacterized protein LOC133757676 [Lepus europaeus]